MEKIAFCTICGWIAKDPIIYTSCPDCGKDEGLLYQPKISFKWDYDDMEAMDYPDDDDNM